MQLSDEHIPDSVAHGASGILIVVENWFPLLLGYQMLHVSKRDRSRLCRDGSRISGKGIHMYKGMGVGFADFISFFLNIP